MERQRINVHKFGGAALATAELIKMLIDRIVHNFETNLNLFVFSAIKGDTRSLLALFEAIEKIDQASINGRLHDFELTHSRIIEELSPKNKKMRMCLESFMEEIRQLILSQDKYYSEEMQAALLQFGELFSSKIISLYLESLKIENVWIDAREYIKTKGSIIAAKIAPVSEEIIAKGLPKIFRKSNIVITQGFIGSSYSNGKNSILPFDGSDTSAAFFAHSIMANKMIFYKDVCGVSSKKNPHVDDTSNFYHQMTYQEYLNKFTRRIKYPVHPDAIKLLKIRKIPTRICSFKYPSSYGTSIIM